MPKIAILHTTPVTVEPLKALAAELLPGVLVVNFVDDSILPQLIETGDLQAVEPRLVQYAKFAEEVGAEAILSACSSVGELATSVQTNVRPPVIRIDEAMAEEAVRTAERVGVAATLPTTLGPTLTLLERKACEAGREVELSPICVEEAYTKLMAGDREGHDRLLSEALEQLAARVDVVVLAQASMARVLSALPAEQQAKFLTSPRSGMERVRQVLETAPEHA